MSVVRCLRTCAKPQNRLVPLKSLDMKKIEHASNRPAWCRCRRVVIPFSECTPAGLYVYQFLICDRAHETCFVHGSCARNEACTLHAPRSSRHAYNYARARTNVGVLLELLRYIRVWITTEISLMDTNEGIQEYFFNVCRFSYIVFINLISREWAIKIVEIVHIICIYIYTWHCDDQWNLNFKVFL